MIEILIWGVCILILEMGIILRYVTLFATPPEKRKPYTGYGIFFLMFILALFIFLYSFIQASELQRVMR